MNHTLPRPSTTHTYSSTGSMEVQRRTGSLWRKGIGPLRRRRSSPEAGVARQLDFRLEDVGGHGAWSDNALGSASLQGKRSSCEAAGGCAAQDTPAGMGIGRRVASCVVHKAASIARVLTPRKGATADSRAEQACPAQYETTHHTSRPASRSAVGRLRLAFPEIGAEEADTAADFMCSLDHARIRWYGRMYVCDEALCFTGMGVSLSAATSSSKALPEPLGSSGRPRSRSHVQWLESFYSMPQEWPSEDARGLPKRWSLGQASHSTGGCSSSRRPWHRTSLRIAFRDITRVSKESTLALWPNALTVATSRRHYIFTNLVRRDRAYNIIEERRRRVQVACATALPAPLPRRRLGAAPKKVPAAAVVPLPPPPSPEEPVHTGAKLRACTATTSSGETDSTICDQPGIVSVPATVSPPSNGRPSAGGVAAVLCKQRQPVLAAVVWHEQQRRCNGQQPPLRDPIVLMSQTVGQISRNTLFVLVSVVVLCLLSSLAFR
ncbi:hypothetical protein H4R20_003554 [Coemansia guatemalensis]|uniref:GRAM domain-containing protein n=1 Tax=Coemansia guatemalensis TaxID=2761395 RepID=A0A9W8I1K8_9FUNG|nr:hypothetical protein H4R20_003554 [Coemansia guatemalensis]